jgi:hypothetical protein
LANSAFAEANAGGLGRGEARFDFLQFNFLFGGEIQLLVKPVVRVFMAHVADRGPADHELHRDGATDGATEERG